MYEDVGKSTRTINDKTNEISNGNKIKNKNSAIEYSTSDALTVNQSAEAVNVEANVIN